MTNLERFTESAEMRKNLLSYLHKIQEASPVNISGVKFCLKKVIDDRPFNPYIDYISSMAAIPYIAILGSNTTKADEESIRLHQSRNDEYLNASSLIINCPSGTLGEIIVRAQSMSELENKWIVQKKGMGLLEGLGHIAMPQDLDRIVKENGEMSCLSVYLYKENEDGILKADFFPLNINAKEIIALCKKENKGWMEEDKVDVKSDEMLKKFLESPENFFNALWNITRAKVPRSTKDKITRLVILSEGISGSLTSFGYRKISNWAANEIHRINIVLKINNISRSSFEEGILEIGNGQSNTCNVEIYWLATGEVYYYLIKKEPGGKEHRERKENLNEATKEYLASIIDMLHFPDV